MVDNSGVGLWDRIVQYDCPAHSQRTFAHAQNCISLGPAVWPKSRNGSDTSRLRSIWNVRKKGNVFLHCIIALDEAWALAYEPEMKRQSNEWCHYGSPCKCSRIPAVLRLCSFSPMTVPASSSHMLCPSIGQSQSSTTPISWSTVWAVCCGRRNHTFLVKNTNHSHDNARPHVTDVVNQLRARWQWEVLYHPPYSPDVRPFNFYLIPNVKEPLHSRRLKTIPDIIDAVGRSVRTINKTGAAKGIMRLPHSWNMFYITGCTSRVCENMNSVGVLNQKLLQGCQN